MQFVVVVVGRDFGGAVKGAVIASEKGAVAEDEACNAPHWAAERVETPSMCDGVAFTLILLSREKEAGRRGCLEFAVKGCTKVKFPRAEVQADIVQPESGVIIRGASIFPRSEEEEESDADHVGKGAFRWSTK